MSFTAENNVIRVTDTNGDVVFDTGTPMPHITNVLTKQVTHTFPNADHWSSLAYQGGGGSVCPRTEWYWDRVCNPETVCRTERVCRTEYVCNYDWQTSQNICGYEYVCGNERVCRSEQVCRDVQRSRTVYDPEYITGSKGNVGALEHASYYNIGSVAAGTNPDFLLVNMVANRTSAGAQSDLGTFVSAIPHHRRISGNGSTLLESAYIPGGAPWLSRILTVYIEGNTIKAEFKHSNRHYETRLVHELRSCYAYPDPNAPRDYISSVWTVDFEVHVGKFTL